VTHHPVRSVLNALRHGNIRRAEECSTLLRWLDPKPGERILDVGCGDGYYDSIIAGSGAHVTGIDIHEQRLRLARRRFGGARTDFLWMDGERMDLAAASFDKAVSFCVIEHFSDDESAIRNVSKALKKGGLFVFSADSLSHPGIRPKEREFHRRLFAVHVYYTRETVEPKLARAGFEIVRTQYLHNSSRSLRLFRLSWKLDALRGWRRIFRTAGYAALGSIGQVILRTSQQRTDGPENGLTLLVMARRRADP
jgi:SAM-dependent methyltransferase